MEQERIIGIPVAGNGLRSTRDRHEKTRWNFAATVDALSWKFSREKKIVRASYEQFEANMKKIKVQGGVERAAMTPLLLTLHGQVPSGKNQVQLLWRKGKVHKYPNKTYANWRSRSHIQIEEQQLPAVRTPTITVPVRLTCVYTPGDLRTRDVSGQTDAVLHLLVYAKVLKDDGLVHELTWRRLPMNRTQPMVTLTIEGVQP